MTTMETPPEDNVDSGKAKHLATGNLDSPAIAPTARSAIYISALVINVVAVVFFGLASIFGWIDSAQGDKALALVVGAISLISNGLSVGYRPTRSLT